MSRTQSCYLFFVVMTVLFADCNSCLSHGYLTSLQGPYRVVIANRDVFLFPLMSDVVSRVLDLSAHAQLLQRTVMELLPENAGDFEEVLFA